MGRDQELAFVVSVVEQEQAGGVLLAGPAGVGKTRLAGEAVEELKRRGWHSVRIAATTATTAIPLGAVAHLVPRSAPGSSDRVSLVSQLVETIMAQAGDARVVVDIDDAHLLDELSAVLVHHVANSGIAQVIMTVRSGEPGNPAITSLYKDGRVERLELQQLSYDEMGGLLSRVLGGYVSERTLRQLWDASNGNVLYLRELVLDALDAGTLAAPDGVWTWSGGLGRGARLSEVIGERLAGLRPVETSLVELLAVAEPAEVAFLERMAPEADLADLERRGIVETSVSGRRIEARLAHPLYGEMVRAHLGAYRNREICRLLADQLEMTGCRRQGDMMRLALWRVRSGAAYNADQLIVAAEQANRIHDPVTAEVLARAATAIEASFGASLQLGAALVDQARYEEAEAVLSGLSPDSTDDAGRKALAVKRMRALFYGLGRADEAETAVASLESAMEEEPHRLVLRGWRAMMLSNAGLFREASELAEDLVLSDDQSSRLVGLPILATARLQFGRVQEARSLSEQCLEIVGTAGTVSAPLGALYMMIVAAEGHLDGADAMASSLLLPAAAGQHRAAEVAVVDAARGHLRLLHGRPRSALQVLTDSAGLLRVYTTGGFLGWCLTQIAEAAALLGDTETARRALDEADDLDEGAIHLFDGSIARSRAWCHGVEGAWSRAADELDVIGEELVAKGHLTEAFFALHDAFRVGASPTRARRLVAIGSEVEGRLAATAVLHARAVLEKDRELARTAASDFEKAGYILVAAEVYLELAEMATAQGAKREATLARRQGEELLGLCEGASTPRTMSAPASGRLTKREREVAALAEQGLSNKQIAERLFTSVRTVESHLQQVYAKLGITERAALVDVLGPSAPVRRRNENR